MKEIHTLTHLTYRSARKSAQAYNISIVIPTYQRDEMLEQAIRSALTQDLCPAEYEIIVLDNANSQQTYEKVHHIGSDTDRTLSFYQNRENLGMWGNINLGCQVALGEWVLILPDDDLLFPTALADFLSIQHKIFDDVWALSGSTKWIYQHKDQIPALTPTISPVLRIPIAANLLHADQIRLLSSDLKITDVPKFCSTFFRREKVLELGGFKPEFAGFADMALILLIQASKHFYVVGRKFGAYRIHEGNDSARSRLWKTFPIDAGGKLVQMHLQERSVLTDTYLRQLQKWYFYQLIATDMPMTERKLVAHDILVTIGAGNPLIGYLLQHTIFLQFLHVIRRYSRPIIKGIMFWCHTLRSRFSTGD